MILIITFKEDYTVDFIINKLNRRNISYKRLNCEDILTLPYSIHFGANGRLNLMGVEKFDAVWFRRTKLPELGNMQPAEKIYLLGEIEAFIQNLFCTIKSNWLSEPFFVYRAENKFLQLQEAKDLGFQIPETIITNDRRELEDFYERHNKHIIVKPISRSRVDYPEEPQFIFTSLVTPDIMHRLEEHDLTPCIFQQAIEKEHELRITVVGNKVFPAVVFSQDDPDTLIDWRRKKLNFQAIDIPVEISNRCVKLVKALNLKFGAIDIIKDKKGDYIFLEINPNGQWAWIEMQTELPIADAIIEVLTC